MAKKYTDNPEYSSAFNKANELGTKLYGYKDRQIGLANDLDRLANQFGENSKQYKAAKAKFDKMQAEYNAAQAKLDAIKKEVDDFNAAEKKKKDTANKEKDKNKSLSLLEEQRKSAIRRNDTAKAEEIQRKIDDLKKPVTADGATTSNAQVPLTEKQLLENEFAKAGISSNGMVQYGFPNPNGQGTTTQSAYIYYEPGNQGKYVGSRLEPKQEGSVQFGTTDEVVNKYYDQLRKQFGDKQGVVDALYSAGILNTNKNVPAGSLLSGLDKVVSAYTGDQVLAFKDGVREFPSLKDYLSNFKGKGGGTSYTRTSPTISSDTEAYNLALRIAQQFAGKKLDDNKMKELVKLLQEQQAKNPAVEQITEDAQGRIVGRKTTTTGLDPQGFLINQISQGDDAKTKQVLDYYSVYKRSMGVQ